MLFCVFSFATGVSPNLPAFFIFRSITAFAGTCFLVVGSACLSDVYRPTERGTALGWFLGGTLIGPALGPFIGGVIVTFSSWKSLFWFQGALGAVAMALSVAFLPETSHGKWSEELEGLTVKGKVSQIWEWANPFRVIALFKYPKILIVVSLSSLAMSTTITVSLLWFPAVVVAAVPKFFKLDSGFVAVIFKRTVPTQ